MCPSMPQRPERSAVGHTSMSAQKCIFIAIIDYIQVWSEEEMIFLINCFLVRPQLSFNY